MVGYTFLISPLNTKTNIINIIYLNLQVGENYLYFFNSTPNICKSWCLNTHSIHNNNDLPAEKQIKNDYSRA